MRRVLIESPFAYRHDDVAVRRIGVLRNCTYARLAVHDCYLRGEAAYASHLFYTQPHILDDDVPEERQFGIDAGLAWGAAAEATVLYRDLGTSRGMRYGIENAAKAGRPVHDRNLFGWENALLEEPRETLLRLGLYRASDLNRIAEIPEDVFMPMLPL